LENYKTLISLASHENAETEVFILKRDLKSIRVCRNEIVEAQNIVEEGVAIRVVKDGGIGFSVTNKLEYDSLERAFKHAMTMAKSSTKSFNWGHLPENSEHSRPPASLHLSDKELTASSPEDVTDLALRMLKQTASCDQAICSITCVVMVLSEEFSILNSHGLEHLSEQNSVLHSRIIVEAKKSTRYSTAMKQFSSRRLSEFSPEEEVAQVISMAGERLRLPSKTISKGRYDVILAPEAVGAFISYLVSPMIVGKSTQQGVSCFADLLDDKVAADSFSLIDNGRVEDGLGSAIVDDEGTPTGPTAIIENGVLKGFLYDILTACQSGTASTGNARRASDTLGRTYLAHPEPLPTNLIVRNGDYSSDELIEETEKGILIDSLNYTFPLVPERGYFSIMSSFPALLVENGEIVGHVLDITISDELREALMKISGVGNLAQQSLHIGSVVAITPHLRMRDMAVSQKG
jgi:predicted Zn-dependent protease